MALNCVMLDTRRLPVPLPNEGDIMSIKSGAEVTVLMPGDPAPGSSSSSAGSRPMKKLKAAGGVWLTDQRLIFVAAEDNPTLNSMTVPLLSLLSTAYEQPYLGSNYLSIDVKPTPEGGLTLGSKMEIRFKDRGIFEFSDVVQKTRERAIYMKRQAESEEDTLPTYEDGASDRPPTLGGAATPNIPGTSTPVPEEGPPGYNAPSYNE